MVSKITSSFSQLPAYRLWVVSIFSMTLPPLIGMFSFDFSKSGDPTERLILFCGFFVKLIEDTHFFTAVQTFGYTASNVIAMTLIVGIIAMWLVILALPAFNQYSMKKRFRIHAIQFIYATVQAVAGYLHLEGRYGP